MVGWTEIIKEEIQFIDFRNAEQTKMLPELRDKLYGLWQVDRSHDGFSVWAGDQRAIGELMIEERNNRLSCIGYASLLKKIPSNEELLLKRLQDDVSGLAANALDCYPRLTEIQHVLIDLLDYLDPDGIRFPEEKRNYI